jgi:hypothetical protein
MPRKLRVEYPGAMYHVMSRGDRCENIFLDDVDPSGNGCLRTACDYVHLNPVRAGILKAEERLLAYPWSSWPAYLAAPEHRPHWVRVDRLLGEHGLQEDTAANREEFERRMEARRLEEADPEALKEFRRGWYLGTDQRHRRPGAFGDIQKCQRSSAPVHDATSTLRPAPRPTANMNGNELCYG